MVLGKQGPLSKALTAGIGLAQEYKAHQKNRKESEAGSELPVDDSDHHDETLSTSEDDEQWAQDLDEAEAEHMPAPPYQQSNPDETIDGIVDSFLSSQVAPSNMNSEKLPQPIVLPQRRPGMRTRGWIRGYAPILAGRGVSQNAWLDFLAGFEKAIGKNRWFHVLNLAVWIADKISLAVQGVSLIVRVVSTVIHLMLETSRRGYIHDKQNKYLDRLNNDYFKPRGLYALVIKYQPKKQQSSNPFSSSSTTEAVPEPLETIDINTNTAEVVENRMDNEGKFWKGLMKGAASKVTHEEEIPEFAELIFPYLDELTIAEKESAVKRNGAFLADYYDRRAQTKFALDHPDSKLADVAPRKEFASEYADPANPKSQGDLISTISGGKVDSPSTRLRRRGQQRRSRLGIGGNESVLERVQGRKEQRESKRPIKKLLRQDALYLMVVDLPSQAEQEAVVKAIEALADE